MSTGYRFYLLERGNHIADVRVCECTTDADALAEAKTVLQGSEYPAVEVWDGLRRVGALSKPAGK